ncbi:MAG: exosortase A [Pseudomonadota bacterium]
MIGTFKIIPAVWRLPLLTLALTLAVLVVMLAETISSMVMQWQASRTYHHCFFVLPISLVLLWRQRKRLAQLSPREERQALLPLAAFALIWLIAKAGQVQVIEHLALVAMTISIVIAMLGREFATVAAFPLGFLLFLVPFGDVFIPGLKLATADAVAWMLRAIGISVIHDGVIMETPGGLFEIAEALAGIHVVIASMMIGALASYLALGRLRHGALLMALGGILVVATQSLCVCGIVLVTAFTHGSFPSNFDHAALSWGLFAIIMLAVVTVSTAIVNWPSSNGEHSDPSEARPDMLGWRPAMAMLVVILIAAPALYASNMLSKGPVSVDIRPELMLEPTLALDLGPECDAQHEPSTGWRPSFQHADMIQSLKVICGNKPVDLIVAYYAYERSGSALVQYGNRLADGERWTRIATSWHKPAIDGLPKVLIQEEIDGHQARDRLVVAWYWIGGKAISKTWQAKAYGLYRKLIGKDEPAALVALSAAYDNRPEEALPVIKTVLAHHKRIDAYLRALAPDPN